jgi:hypothetical protein
MIEITLNDNTKINTIFCGVSDNILWMDIPGMTIPEGVIIFSNSEKTSRIILYENLVYEEYTKLITLSLRNERLQVALQKEVTT